MNEDMNAKEFSKPLLFGTSNLGKLSEVRIFAGGLGFSVIGLDAPEITGTGSVPEVAEVASTYAGNAVIKALAYAKYFGRPCLADDTGIEIAMLSDLPGVHTARWGLSRVIDEVGILRTVATRFVCAMAYAEPSGRTVVTHGTLEGELRDMVLPADGVKPLPFGEFFFPKGSPYPLAYLVGNGYEGSHRFRALASLVRVLS